ncbi:hypothetical protein L1987_75826 [Smallanthus sonchifolius]|uniref:Uncharacterized protein n=1 Tax=Smallanthus sonchifolius TaxID=185202 RepID=A0ACB9A620_9ASTR|nr:hypothetical protein L1987_75826 [Smallanthus sonchifolius]
MSYADKSPGHSGLFERSTSIDYTMPSTYETHGTGPGLSSLGIGNSDSQVSPTSQRSVPDYQVVDQPPVEVDVRHLVNSSNQITDGIDNRGWDDPTGGKAQSFSDLLHDNKSGYDVSDGKSEERPPTQSDFAERERSNNGGFDGAESVNPADYAGISLVGKKFKLLNPEAYYVETD